MTTNGTLEAEQTLNDKPTDDQLFSALSQAMEKGDDAEISRLMEGSTVPADTPEATTPPIAVDNTATSAVEIQGATAPGTPAAEITNDNVDVRALLSELHAIKSRVGRFDSVQRELSEVKRQLKDQAAGLAAIPKPPSKIDERLDRLKEIDPELAETLLEMKNSFTSSTPAPAEEPVQDDYMENELSRVRRVHPDVDQVLVGGGLRPEWEQWKSLIRPEHAAMASSSDAVEFSLAYSAFLSDLPALRQRSTNLPATQQPVVATPDPQAAAVQAERERKLAGNAPIAAAPLKQDVPGKVDEASEFSRILKEIQSRDNLV